MQEDEQKSAIISTNYAHIVDLGTEEEPATFSQTLTAGTSVVGPSYGDGNLNYGTPGNDPFLAATPWWPTQAVPNISALDEIRIREKAVEFTIQAYGNNDQVDFGEFHTTLDSIYQFLRYGTPLSETINKELTNNNF
jgi:hypothetical protein